ncbi:hypothetical protein ACFYY8_31555 [Streptosporangium sp. NPDC001559]|uniref:hypothetical protein n=1 Tax=Streptosporangium sp. NPDC001559 TaxID=3366187 RepID=UPI0036E3131C
MFTALPAQGYEGEAPDFPLPLATAREVEVWDEVWRTPQAEAWSVQPWRWRAVALYVRWSVRMEAEDASASLGQVVIRYADQIGLTPAGLKENGWKIAEDELASKRREASDDFEDDGGEDVRSRLTVVSRGAGG